MKISMHSNLFSSAKSSMTNVASIVLFVGVKGTCLRSKSNGPDDRLSSPISELYLFYLICSKLDVANSGSSEEINVIRNTRYMHSRR